MKVNVKYFGAIAESAGKSEEVLDLEKGSSVKDLKNQQIKKYQIQDADSIQIAVNQDLKNEVELKDGDEVAFLPPFAGG
ncbi:molybdopterin synthase sulfur carrier subunit [Gillisia mitskevichiae]|uniref:Molybdopterin synthase sulfur carrier subunit n=1 Tax=Gillisia mitskevichiae TaxID=270921 RepID=A0A495PYR7_9FLAO|nr:MoaD/ThiS family protein [Gillisia mitskevichiae]RKS55726.1 molybdopterin synthase sulfur carrier subunit [Gillisia mitskevichiae]